MHKAEPYATAYLARAGWVGFAGDYVWSWLEAAVSGGQFHSAKGAVAGQNQDHVGRILRVSGGIAEGFALAGVGLVLYLEDAGLVIQVDLFCPRGQRRVRFGTAHEDNVLVRQ